MKIYQGISASPGLIMGQVSRLDRVLGAATRSPLSPQKERSLLAEAIRLAKTELEAIAERSASGERAIFVFQSMILEDEGFLNKVYAYINAGTAAAVAVERVGQRYADQLHAMVDNPYMRLRDADVLDVCQRVINILDDRPRERLVLDHPVIIAADLLMPSDLFSLPTSMILGVVVSEGSTQSHASILARALKIPAVVQVGRDFLDDCDGHALAVDAVEGTCILDPDSETRQMIVTRICERQRENEEIYKLRDVPDRTRDGTAFEILANCFGPDDIDSAIRNGAHGVGLLRSGYLMLPNHTPDEQEQYDFYISCLSAAQGRPITVRTFDFGVDKTIESAYHAGQSSQLGLRGVRYSLRQPRQFEMQLRALLRAGTRGAIRVMFPMVTDVEDWNAAMRIVERCRQNLRERGVPFDEDMQFGVMLSIPSACLTAEDFIRCGCRFFSIGTNDLTQYTHAADRNLSSVESYYRPASPAMKKLIGMVMEAARAGGIPVTICGLAVGNAANAVQYLHMGLRSFSMSPQNLLEVKRALLEEDVSGETKATSEEGPGADRAGEALPKRTQAGGL